MAMSASQHPASPKFGACYQIMGDKDDIAQVKKQLKEHRVFVREHDAVNLTAQMGEDNDPRQRGVVVYSGVADRVLGRLSAIADAPFYAVRSTVGFPLQKASPYVQYMARGVANAIAGITYLVCTGFLGLATSIPDALLYARKSLSVGRGEKQPRDFLLNATDVLGAMDANVFDVQKGTFSGSDTPEA